MNVHPEGTTIPKPSRKRSRFLLLLIWTAAMLAGPAAHATMLCVATVNGGLDNNDFGLMAAISTANTSSSGGTWDIRLRYGTYQLSDDLWFGHQGNPDNKALYLSGGWDDNCQNQTGRAHDTIVRGAPGGFSTRFEFQGNNARYDIRKIRFENFARFYVNDGTCGFPNICPDTDTVRIEQNEFDNGGSIWIAVGDAKRMVFRNNLVTNLYSYDPTVTTFQSVSFNINNNEDAPQITYNTFANLNCKAGDNGGVYVYSAQPQVALHHNIVQTNGCGNGIFIDTGGFPGSNVTAVPQTPYYNLFSSIGGGFEGNLLANGNVVSTNPKFVDAPGGNYRLQATSPAVNAGSTLLDALLSGFDYSPYDLDGKTRPFGAHFDIGAYESNVYDTTIPVITVNSANDVDDGTCDATHCSLREAINLANFQDGSDQRIVFDVPGACPRVILLNSELPDITDTVTIDGYTQPGANENSLDFGSDANICIALSPGATGVAHALAVTSAEPATTKLVVRGLGFGNGFYVFGTDAIDLRGGTGHRIVGNAFGGYLPPSHNTSSLGTLARAVVVRGTATNVRIGTTLAADRNYLGNLTQNGIVLNDATSAGHRIENNYIGVRPDGLTAQANQADGISASGGTNVTINGNTIVANASYGIALLGAGTTKFTITRNNIGVNALGIPNDSLSNDVGIEIGLGSGQHVIGAPFSEDLQTGKYSNFIDNNKGDGIMLAADASASTTIRGNAIGNNGRSGTGIGIDLGGSQVQLANDFNDSDSGPNALQNFPVIKGSAPLDASTRKVNALLRTSANQTVRVDFYQSLSCSSVKGADASYMVGTFNANSGATGVVSIGATIAEAGKSGYLTATATTAGGQTSELAPCVAEDVIFSDGAD